VPKNYGLARAMSAEVDFLLVTRQRPTAPTLSRKQVVYPFDDILEYSVLGFYYNGLL